MGVKKDPEIQRKSSRGNTSKKLGCPRKSLNEQSKVIMITATGFRYKYTIQWDYTLKQAWDGHVSSKTSSYFSTVLTKHSLGTKAHNTYLKHKIRVLHLDEIPKIWWITSEIALALTWLIIWPPFSTFHPHGIHKDLLISRDSVTITHPAGT